MGDEWVLGIVNKLDNHDLAGKAQAKKNRLPESPVSGFAVMLAVLCGHMSGFLKLT